MKRLQFIIWALFVAVLHTQAFAVDSLISAKNQTITIKGKNISLDMVYVQGGTFRMGCSIEQINCEKNEMPSHTVILDSFYIGKFEVTQSLWTAVMKENPSAEKGANLPVENVSWNECQTFIAKLNALTGKKFRLPTEAEWEYAARGGKYATETIYAGSNSIEKVARYNTNSTHAVGTKEPNELGIYDMSGNVWEWCNDWMGDYSRDTVTNPNGPEKGTDRILRGGNFVSTAENCRIPTRNWRTVDSKIAVIGFRLVMQP